ncbi:MAG: ORF6N domain-containing protein [Limisphaerales bacterium]
MKRNSIDAVDAGIEPLIVEVRRQKVILDSDLAQVYGVPTKALNQAVKRNASRFPADFLFQLTLPETDLLMRSQFVTASCGAPASVPSKRNIRHLPYAFTEHGAIMAANVLNSERAAQMSVFVVRAFVKLRSALSNTGALARKLVEIESELKSRLDVHEAALVHVLQRIMKILDPPPPPPEPPQPQIGFHVKEEPSPYRVKKRLVHL